MKHFLFQTRFWFTLEVLLNIWKITSNQTSTVQRPFWGPLSLGHCRKTVTPSPRQGQWHMGSCRSHALLQTIGGGALCRKNLLHNPQMLLCPSDCEGQQWYEGQMSQTGLVQRQVNNSSSALDLATARALQVRCEPQLWQTAWGGLVLQQDNQCGSTLRALMEDYIHTPATSTCQRSPELLKPRETPTNNPAERCIRIWRARGRPASWKCIIFFIYTTEKEKDG